MDSGESESGERENGVCCICYEHYDCSSDIVIIKHVNDATLAVSRKRGHYFHKHCLLKWRDTHGTCPLDRDKILKLYTVPVYQIVGLEMGMYDYDYYHVVHQIKINDILLDQWTSSKDIDDPDKKNKTLAFYACQIGNYALVSKLKRRGADFYRLCGHSDFTPLMVAVCHNHYTIVEKLLPRPKPGKDGKDGKDGKGVGGEHPVVYQSDKQGHNAFYHACQYAYADIIKLFLRRNLATRHQVAYNLGIHRDQYNNDDRVGQEIISVMRRYLR